MVVLSSPSSFLKRFIDPFRFWKWYGKTEGK
jgi:hypothetical protein